MTDSRTADAMFRAVPVKAYTQPYKWSIQKKGWLFWREITWVFSAEEAQAIVNRLARSPILPKPRITWPIK